MTSKRAVRRVGAVGFAVRSRRAVLCVILALSLAAGGVAGCTIGTVDTAPTSVGGAPSASGGRAHRVEPVRDDSIRYEYLHAGGDANQNYGNLYLPRGAHQVRSLPVVMLVHGGGWKNRSSSAYMAQMARSLQAAGLAVWNVEYRRVGSGGGWPTTFTDVGSALDFIPELARSAPALDATNVIVVGHSAGGQLAAWAASRRTLPRDAPGVSWPEGGGPRVVPRAFVSLAGVLDMRTSSRLNDHVRMVLGGMPSQVPERYKIANPIQQIDPHMPAVALHGDRDVVVPMQESIDFVAAAQARGTPALFIRLNGALHSSPVSTRARWWPTIEETIVRLARHGFEPLAANPPIGPQ